MRKKTKTVSTRKYATTRTRTLLTMLLPGTLWLLVFSYVPMFGVILAFKTYKLAPGGNFVESLLTSPWAGIENFKFMFTTSDAWIMVRNTLGYNLAWMVVTTVVPLALAIMLSELTKKRLSKTYQTLMFFPHFLSWVVVSYFVFMFLSPTNGILNGILEFFGAQPIEWYAETGPWPAILTIANLWKGTGYGSVLYLATIAGIDRTYYEAAMIDGASKWKQVVHITLPSLKIMLVITLIMRIGGIFRADFGLFYNVPRNMGQLFPVTQVVDTFVYRALVGTRRIDLPAAAGLFQSLVGFVTILAANAIVRKVDEESSLF
ncbi:MAG: ABC transporter permease subunit [Clostridium sp.]|nr:ABC transporter permease subunit [Clostridium sp.]